MPKRITIRNSPLLLFLTALSLAAAYRPDWGFFAHKRINRLAVFTLPQDMLPVFKREIEFLTEHAVDADKRRYATRHEAVRHYIDLDHWGEAPFDTLPRYWGEAVMRFASPSFYDCKGRRDTFLALRRLPDGEMGLLLRQDTIRIDGRRYDSLFREMVLPQYYRDRWLVAADTFTLYTGIRLDSICSLEFVDSLSGHGILPYHLLRMHRKLTNAFAGGDLRAILRFSADIGHYIGDAHVPLHTTENYNGQLTGQNGIHAFWESRIPELFADRQYDYLVGKARYIEDPRTYYWNIVLRSHSMVDSVLSIEKQLSRTFPADRQYCYVDRNQLSILSQCPEYAEEYQRKLNGMVERRMRSAILAVGSAWYSAWVDAGQPDLSKLVPVDWALERKREGKRKRQSAEDRKRFGRKHENR